ncbi:MAG: hypothetical protein WBG95_08835 [Sulfitobacter sp.]
MIVLTLALAILVAQGSYLAKPAQASDTTVPEVLQKLAVLAAAHDHRGNNPVVGDTPPVVLSGAFRLPQVEKTQAQIVSGRILSNGSYLLDIRPPVRAPPEN